MKVKMFSVFDSKAKCFRFPQFYDSTGQAIRAFTMLANDPQTEVGKFPEDFSLHEHAEFNNENGEITELTSPVNLGLAATYKKEDMK